MIRATLIILSLLNLPDAVQDPKDHPNSFGELYWVPTHDQALEMAKATGRPIFLMGYSLVPDGSTYTAASDDSCKSVF